MEAVSNFDRSAGETLALNAVIEKLNAAPWSGPSGHLGRIGVQYAVWLDISGGYVFAGKLGTLQCEYRVDDRMLTAAKDPGVMMLEILHRLGLELARAMVKSQFENAFGSAAPEPLEDSALKLDEAELRELMQEAKMVFG